MNELLLLLLLAPLPLPGPGLGPCGAPLARLVPTGPITYVGLELAARRCTGRVLSGDGATVRTVVVRGAEEDRGDRWFGEDKLKHFFMSFALTNLSFGAYRTIGLDDAPGVFAAGVTAGAAGVWKEWYDERQGKPFSVKDLVWDGLGIGLGLLLAANTR